MDGLTAIKITDALMREFGRTEQAIESALAADDLDIHARNELNRRQFQVKSAWDAFLRAGNNMSGPQDRRQPHARRA